MNKKKKVCGLLVANTALRLDASIRAGMLENFLLIMMKTSTLKIKKEAGLPKKPWPPNHFKATLLHFQAANAILRRLSLPKGSDFPIQQVQGSRCHVERTFSMHNTYVAGPFSQRMS